VTDKPVRYYSLEDNGYKRCLVCPHHCRLKEGQRGICRVRMNQEGQLLATNYGEFSALALDPIEKKPLYHFYPGSLILSAGSFGCNLSCPFCQNYHIAHQMPATRYISPDELVEINLACWAQGSIGMAFTYNEPVMWLEYIMDAAPLLQEQGFKVVMVSNGYIETRPLQDLLGWVDAFNIDLKGFSERYYQRMCMGKLAAVQETLTTIAARAHLEVTNLLIPGENDREDEIRDMCCWLAKLDPEMVLHFSAYHPAYKMNLPPTSGETLRRAADIAHEYLKHVYLGNLPGEGNDSLCPDCGQVLISRTGYKVEKPGLEQGRCKNCGKDIPFLIEFAARP